MKITQLKNPLPQCVKLLYLLFSSLEQSFGRLSRSHVLTRLLNLFAAKSLQYVSALREVPAGLNALRLSAIVNKRIYTGLILIWVVAPAGSFFYLIFDKHNPDYSWFHLNYYYLFAALGQQITTAIVIIGIFHVFTPSWRTFLVAIPLLGWTVAKIIHMVLCTTNEEWLQLPTLEIIAIGVCSSIVLIVSVEWFAWRNFHKFQSIPARIKGIINAPGIPADQKIQLIESENNKLFTFHKTY